MDTPKNWFSRLLMTLTAAALLVVGFFFLTAALLAGALIALVVGVRLWWTLRKARRMATTETAGSGTLEGEYVVVERDVPPTTPLPVPPPSNTPPAP